MEQLARPTPSAITTYITTHTSPSSSAQTAAYALRQTNQIPVSPVDVDVDVDQTGKCPSSLVELAPHSPQLLHLAHIVLHNLQYQHDWTDLELHRHGPIVVGSRARFSSESSPARQVSTSIPASSHPSPWPTTTTAININTNTNTTNPLPRPLITGRPPRPLYIHPDTQIALIRADVRDADLAPELVTVLPTHLAERLSLRALADVFDFVPGPDGIVLPRVGLGEDFAQEDGDGDGDGAGVLNAADYDDSEGVDGQGAGQRTSRPSASTSATPAKPARTVRNGDAKRVLLAAVDDDSTVVYYIVHDGIVKPRQN